MLGHYRAQTSSGTAASPLQRDESSREESVRARGQPGNALVHEPLTPVKEGSGANFGKGHIAIIYRNEYLILN